MRAPAIKKKAEHGGADFWRHQVAQLGESPVNGGRDPVRYSSEPKLRLAGGAAMFRTDWYPPANFVAEPALNAGRMHVLNGRGGRSLEVWFLFFPFFGIPWAQWPVIRSLMLGMEMPRERR